MPTFSLATPSTKSNNELIIEAKAKLEELNKDLQDAWDTPIPPFYDLPEKLIMNREQGKKLWKFLLTKRDIPYEVIIIVDDEERRALSIAYALSETIKIPKCMIYLPRDPDFKKGDEQAPNGHIYSVAKSSRGLVV